LTEVADAFERLVAALEERGSRIGSYLNPGAGEAAVTEVLQAAGAGAHRDLVDLYCWHDGTDLAGLAGLPAPPELVPGLDFLPLLAGQPDYDTSLTRHRFYVESMTGPVDQGGWPPGWYPVFRFGPDVAVDTATGEVWLWAWPWYAENRFVSRSLADFAGTIVRHLDDGTWVLDESGLFSQHDLY
jgi:cell wall assembly regulator SMI1